MVKSVRMERTHWRDAALSERHRLWGYDCPAVDVDFLLIEYDRKVVKGLVDYKHEALPEWRRNSSSAAIADLGTKAGIPVFVCGYAEDFSWFWPIPVNEEARKWIPERDGHRLSEKEWVEMLYAIRGRSMPADVPFTGVDADDNSR